MSVTVISIIDPLNQQKNEKEIYEFIEGNTVSFYLKHINLNVKNVNFIVALNGTIVNKINDIVVNDDSYISVVAKIEVTAAIALGNFVAGSLLSAGAGLAASFYIGTAIAYTAYAAGVLAFGYGLSLLSSVLAPDAPTPDVINNPISPQTYGWGDPTQSTVEGASIPYLFGSNLVSGQVLNYFTQIVDNDEQINILLGICDHEVDSITDVKLNGRDSTYFSTAVIETRLGTLSDSLIEGFGDIITTTNVNSPLVQSIFQEVTTTGSLVEKIIICVTAPYGMYSIGSNGVRSGESAKYRVDYKLESEPTTWTIGDVQTLSGNQTTALRETYVIDSLSPGKYDVRIARTDAENSTDKAHDNIYFTFMQEVIKDENLTYPGLAKYSVQILATDQLSGSLPNFTCVATKSSVDIWDEEIGTPDYVSKRATNPAWIVWYLLHNYAEISNTRLIWDEFNTWADYCDEIITHDTGTSTSFGSGTLSDTTKTWSTNEWVGSTLVDSASSEFIITSNTSTTLSFATGTPASGAYSITDYRFIVNVVISEGNFWDKIQEIAKLGRASIIRRGTRYGVFIDYEDSTVSHLFSMGNIIDGSLNISYLPQIDAANVVEVEYTDPNRDYSRQVITIQSDDYLTSTDVEKKANTKIQASIPQKQAVREGVYIMNTNNFLKEIITFDAFIDSFACTVGDIFYFQHITPDYSNKIGGRIVSAGNTDGDGSPYVVLDRELTISAGESYAFVVRLSDDTLVEKFINSAPTTSDTFVIATSWSTVPDGGEPYFLGLSASYKKKYRITSISRKDDFTRTITGVEYVEDIYTNNDGFVIDEISTDQEIIKASNILLQEVLIFDKGDFRSILNVSWSRYKDEAIEGAKYESTVITWGVWLEDETAGTDPILVGETKSYKYTIPYDYIIEGHEYTVYVNVAETNEGAVEYAS